jgi:hypothetical protein
MPTVSIDESEFNEFWARLHSLETNLKTHAGLVKDDLDKVTTMLNEYNKFKPSERSSSVTQQTQPEAKPTTPTSSVQLSNIIKDLKDGQYNVNVTAEVDEVGAVNSLKGGSLKNQNLQIHDNSGKILLTLWNEETNPSVLNGATLTIQKGIVKAYKGNLQLACGKYGKLSWS